MDESNHNVLCVDFRQAGNYGSDIYEIEKPAQTVSYYRQAANTVNNSQLSWNIQVPSKAVLTDRKIFLECSAIITVTGNRDLNGTLFELATESFKPTATIPRGGQNYYVNNDNLPFCMRGNPISKACDALTVYINGMSITSRISDYSSVFDNVNLWDPEAYRFIHSSSWGRGDACQRLRECGNVVDGTIVSPFGGFPQCSNTITKRDDQTRYYILTNPASTGAAQPLVATMRVEWFEEVMIGPFQSALSKSDMKAIGGVNQLQFVYSLSELERMVLVRNPSNSVAADAINSISVNISDAQLHLCYLTPTSVMGSLPPVLRYNTKLMINYPTPTSTDIRRGAVGNIVQGNIQLSSIPKYLVVFVSKVVNTNLSAAAIADTTGLAYECYSTVLDGCASITNVRLTFNNVTGLLSTATQNDLYNMSCRNGYCGTYDDFIKHKGSILIIDMAKDIGLDALSAVSSAGAYNYNIEVQCYDPSDSYNLANTEAQDNPYFNYRLNTLVINDGLLEITPSSTKLTSSFDRSLVLAALSEGNVDIDIGFKDYIGGAWFNNLGDFKAAIRPVIKKVQDNLPIIEQKYEELKQSLPIPKKVDRGINTAFTYANFISSLIDKFAASGMSAQKIKSMISDHVPEHNMHQYESLIEEMVHAHKKKAGNLRAGSKINKSRLQY